MSIASERGKNFERKVRKITAKILKIEVKRDSRSGAGETHKQDVRSPYGVLPLFIECKDQEKANLKRDWRKADQQSSFGQAPVVVFPDNEETLVVMRYEDLLNFIKEGIDWRESAEKYRVGVDMGDPAGDKSVEINPFELPKKKPAAIKNTSKLKTCRNGHIADQFGYCMAKKCPYNRTYKAPKEKKK